MPANAAPKPATNNMIDRRWWLLLALAWAVFVLLGSWYPFHYRPGTLDDAWSAWSSSGGLRIQARSDLAVNVLVGIPLAFFAVLALLDPYDRAAGAAQDASRRRRGGTASSQRSIAGRLILVTTVVVFVAGWAVVAELGQHWFGYRVPSRADTLAQSLGGLLGAVVAAFSGAWFSGRVATVLGRRAKDSPLTAMLDLYVAGYVVWMGMPFVPASPSPLAAKWHSGSIQLSPFAAWQANPWQAGYTLAVSAATALPLGCWVAWRLRSRTSQMRWVSVAALAAVAVATLEACQFFIETRTMAIDDAIWSAIGAVLGVRMYRRCFASATTTQWISGLSAPMLATATILYSLVYMLVAWAPFEFVDTEVEFQQRLRRFESLGAWLAGNDMLQAASLMRSLFWSAPMGALAATAASASQSKMAWGIALAFLVIVCTVTELGQIASLVHSPSLADLTTRLAGGLTGVTVFRGIYIWNVPHTDPRRSACTTRTGAQHRTF